MLFLWPRSVSLPPPKRWYTPCNTQDLLWSDLQLLVTTGGINGLNVPGVQLKKVTYKVCLISCTISLNPQTLKIFEKDKNHIQFSFVKKVTIAVHHQLFLLDTRKPVQSQEKQPHRAFSLTRESLKKGTLQNCVLMCLLAASKVVLSCNCLMYLQLMTEVE